MARKANRLLDEYREHLAAVTESSIEVKLSPGAAPTKLKELIQNQQTELARLKEDREQIETTYRARIDDICAKAGRRREARKSLTQDRDTKLEQISLRERELEGIYAWKSYQMLNDYLLPAGIREYVDCVDRCEVFLQRLYRYHIQMTCQVPTRNSDASLATLEYEAFAIFA